MYIQTHVYMQTLTRSHTHNHVSQQEHCPTSRLSFSPQPCYSREPAFPTCFFCLFVFFFGRLFCSSVFPLCTRPCVGLEKLWGDMLALQNAPVWRHRTESLQMAAASHLTGQSGSQLKELKPVEADGLLEKIFSFLFLSIYFFKWHRRKYEVFCLLARGDVSLICSS